MTFALDFNVRFNADQGEETRVLPPRTLKELAEKDRQTLANWMVHARAGGIDSVIDLSVRTWNVTGPNAIFGVFKTNENQASWLIVRYGSAWTLARCADGFVSDVSEALCDILRLIDDELLC